MFGKGEKILGDFPMKWRIQMCSFSFNSTETDETLHTWQCQEKMMFAALMYIKFNVDCIQHWPETAQSEGNCIKYWVQTVSLHPEILLAIN